MFAFLRRRSPLLAPALLLAGALGLGGCTTTTLVADSDYDDSYDFSAVQKVTILPLDRTVKADTLISDMQAANVEEALGAELEARGFAVVEDRAEADVYLSWHLVTRERTDIRSYNASSAYNCWRCGPPVSDVSVRQYTEGTLIVDLIDPLRNRSVWRSQIQSRLKAQPDPEQAAKNRAKAAEAILAPFPPEA